jgi:hypothetical protein
MKVTLTRSELKQIIQEEWNRAEILEQSSPTGGYDETVEGQDQELDYEGYMTKSQLFKIGEYALKLHDMINDGDNLPEWMQSKVSQMEKDIGSVYHALEYDIKRGTI